jgi:hypothetical protein
MKARQAPRRPDGRHRFGCVVSAYFLPAKGRRGSPGFAVLTEYYRTAALRQVVAKDAALAQSAAPRSKGARIGLGGDASEGGKEHRMHRWDAVALALNEISGCRRPSDALLELGLR